MMLRGQPQFDAMRTLTTIIWRTALIVPAILALQMSYAHEPTSIKVSLTSDDIVGYWIHLPRDHSSEQVWPVILFLHGGDAVAEDLDYVRTLGPARYLENTNQQDSLLGKLIGDSFVIISPHLSNENGQRNRQWHDYADVIDSIVETVICRYGGDRRRFYITGLSRGGHGTWRLPSVTKHPIAAIVPVCGRSNDAGCLASTTHLPIWNTCNKGDALITVEFQEQAVATIEAAGGDEFLRLADVSPVDTTYLEHRHIFTSFDRQGHDAWTATYGSRHIYEWMLKFSNIDGKILHHD
ncbi:MAG: hypothetical protein JSU65_06995 [Candidatus Zixiibacteriota bacterium]|nr:MAG: hypothetical protein JSU65_06995 [candidate division Zixibacteria bacterium]